MHYSKQYIMINKEPNLYKLKDVIIHLIKNDVDDVLINQFFRLHLDAQEQFKIDINDVKDSIYPLNIRYIKRVI